MKVKLIRDARIIHKAGEIVEVSPDEYNFLISVRSAVPMTEEEKPVKTEEKKKTVKKKG